MAEIPENVKEVEQNVCQNWNGGRLLFESVQGIFTSNLNLHCIAAKFLPRILTPKLKKKHVEVSEDFQQSAWDDLTFT